jgi:hypothetical protein
MRVTTPVSVSAVHAPEVPFGQRVQHMSNERLDETLARKEKRNPNDPDLAVLKAEKALREQLAAGPLPKYAVHIRRMSGEQLQGELKRLTNHPDRKEAETKLQLLHAELARRPQVAQSAVQRGELCGTGKRQHRALRCHDGESMFEAA